MIMLPLNIYFVNNCSRENVTVDEGFLLVDSIFMIRIKYF